MMLRPWTVGGRLKKVSKTAVSDLPFVSLIYRIRSIYIYVLSSSYGT